MSDTKLNRRQFLGTTAVGLGALAAPKLATGVLGANEKIVVGVIGTGGMARHHMSKLKGMNVEFAAVCDVYEPNLAEGMKLAGDKATPYAEHEKLLERKDIDVVVIGTPEHWHHKHLIDAVRAGKDAYCEKPMSWSIEQGAEMVKEVRKTDRVVQIGMQRRSSPTIHEMKREIFDKKVLGNIYLVQAEWYWKYPPNGVKNDELPGKLDWQRFCGPAGEQTFEPMKFRSWRFFWPFSGGNVTDQGTHLMDVVQWMMGVDQPVSALQYGNVYVNKPTETPDVFCCTFEYPDFMATWTLNYSTPKWRNGWSIVFHGEKAALFLTEQGYRVFDQVNGWENGLPKPVREDMPGGVTDTTPHLKNFLECVKSRKDPNATVEIGHKAVRTLHLANIALKKRTRAILDADGVTVRT